MRKRRVKVKKIENAYTRRVTFSKRKECLFREAKELSVLQVAAIVFSHTGGTLHRYSTISADEILLRYRIHRHHLVHQTQQVRNDAKPSNESTTITNLLREIACRMRDLKMDDLERLETALGNGLGKIVSQIQEAKLRSDNRLSQIFSGMSNSNVETVATYAAPRDEEDSRVDTTLVLG